MLVAPRVRMFDPPDRFDAPEVFAVASPVASEHDHETAVVIARAPKPVALMITDRFRQTEVGPEEIDRTRFAIVVGENRGARALLRRKRIVNPRSFRGHLPPAEFISKI